MEKKWRVRKGTEKFLYDISTDKSDKGRNCNVVRNIRNETNARLMAAAPELLRALKIAVGQIHELTNYEVGCEFPNYAEYEESIIAKAEGRGTTE